MEARPTKPDYDQALKRLVLRGHDSFLALITLDLTWRGELSPVLPAIARQADVVWEAGRSDGERGILHVTHPAAKAGGFSDKRTRPSYLPGVHRNYWGPQLPDTWRHPR
jgi:hypothetical protein